ncbi:MunI family type II restriction endonuclease [Candidatus Woesearchaeota archaeon]|nr:MunI family type II restriction endonuclease [Candidatus Woesearchaeota archaeon]
MGKKELSKRDIWQDVSGGKAGIAEKNFFQVFSEYFKDSDFRIRKRPKEFNNIYSKLHLSKKVLAEIYTPDVKEWRHGLIPDYAIDNTKTKKILYVEVKRQDGWVEGKTRQAGRGNAHEGSCKFFTPGLLKILRKHGKLGDNVLPFWVVFQGDITRDPCRVREITCWYDKYSAHFFMWRNSADDKSLINHFNRKLKPLLT